jgi:2-polyprenyl-3-methyl-5-hydroxy-6-metoxy-1,4-benzoquinol methylase
MNYLIIFIRQTDSHLTNIIRAKIIFKNERVEDFIFKPNTYNIVIANYILHFLNQNDRAKIIDSIYDALLPNGILYLKTFHTKTRKIISDGIKDGENIYRDPNPESILKFYLPSYNQLVEDMKRFSIIGMNELSKIDETDIVLVGRKVNKKTAFT